MRFYTKLFFFVIFAFLSAFSFMCIGMWDRTYIYVYVCIHALFSTPLIRGNLCSARVFMSECIDKRLIYFITLYNAVKPNVGIEVGSLLTLFPAIMNTKC